MAWLTRGRSCRTRNPAPRLRCPTSLLPIWPAGRPTASPDASSRPCGHVPSSRSQVGMSALSEGVPLRIVADAEPVEHHQDDGSLAAHSAEPCRGRQDGGELLRLQATRRRRAHRRRPAGRRSRRRSRRSRCRRTGSAPSSASSAVALARGWSGSATRRPAHPRARPPLRYRSPTPARTRSPARCRRSVPAPRDGGPQLAVDDRLGLPGTPLVERAPRWPRSAAGRAPRRWRPCGRPPRPSRRRTGAARSGRG